MEKTNVTLSSGVSKVVDSIFYLYNSKYYFIYTEKEMDDKGYIILYVCQIGKEIINKETGPIATGCMIGIEISDAEEWKKVQDSITKIVDSKKNSVDDSQIQYPPVSMLVNLKIVSKKTFRLLKEVVENVFKLDFDTTNDNENKISTTEVSVVEPINPIEIKDNVEDNTVNSIITPQPLQPVLPITLEITSQNELQTNTDEVIDNIDKNNNQTVVEENNNSVQKENVISNDSDVIIDYRTKYFEEEEKIKELQTELKQLKEKIESVKTMLE